MNQFREIRQRIRSLRFGQYWGISKCHIIVNNTATRRFFIMQGPMPYRTVFEKYYRVSNLQKRLGILEGLRTTFQRDSSKHFPVTNTQYR